MISVAFLLLLGLIIFGPKKTMEIAQEVGRLVAQFRRAVGQFSTVETVPQATGEGLDNGVTEVAVPLGTHTSYSELDATPIQLGVDTVPVRCELRRVSGPRD